MDNFMEEDLDGAVRALFSMLHKCRKSQEKLTRDTWQWTLMKTNICAIQTALSLIEKSPEMNDFTKEELEEAFQILSSTLHRVEKAQENHT